MTSAFLAALAREITAHPHRDLPVSDATAAAVLVPLLAAADDVEVVFTRRAASLPHHRGQVAFPGGTRQAGDRDAEATALREAHEEIGLRPADVRILGRLDEIETVATRFRITPIVGLVPQPYVWTPCLREVDTVFTVPLATLRAPDAEREELWDFAGRQLPIRHFPVSGQVIWGATYRITRNLLDHVARIDAPAACAEVPA